MSLFFGISEVQPDAKGRIPNTAEFDLVISILWSRLGALLDPTLTMPDGSLPGSGTEYEVAWALDHANKNRGVPLLARLSQLYEADAAVGTERGARSLYSAMGLLTGVLCALGKEQRGRLCQDVQRLSRPAGV